MKDNISDILPFVLKIPVMLKIQIPEPCHEDWNKMTPTSKGAYCGACAKEVVDFTRMSDEAVQHYFLNKTGGNTCGRFRHEQLHRIRIHLPETLFIQKTAGWKKYMAVLLLAFGSLLFGCDVDVSNQKNKESIISSAGKTVEAIPDIKSDIDGMVGGMMLVMDTTTSTKMECTTTVGYIVPGRGFDLVVNDMKIDSTVQIHRPDIIVTPAIDIINKIRTERIVSEDTPIIKPSTDTLECNDTGYY